MFKRKMYDRGYLYIFFAVFFLSIFFIGFKVVNDEKKDDENNIATVEAFSYLQKSNETSDHKNLIYPLTLDKNIDTNNNFFLKILTNSNAYMSFILQRGTSKDIIKSNDMIPQKLLNFFRPKIYLKSHLPAILSVVETVEVASSNYNIDDSDTNVPVLEDIIFVEDPIEAEEGETISNTENIENKNYELVKAPDTIKLNYENPSILIYHTHGTEAYLPIEDNQYHTTKRQYNVLTIGEILSNVLKENGHKIIHKDIYHDIPSYSQSYTRSLATAKDMISQEKDIKIVFDIHRDGVDKNASYYDKALKESKININGKEVATFSLVIGPENPNKDKLLQFAQYIKAVSDSLYPGLCKGIIIKPYGKFNQYVSDHYALIEVGSNLNTIEEAKESAKIIGEILNKVIEGIKKP